MKMDDAAPFPQTAKWRRQIIPDTGDAGDVSMHSSDCKWSLQRGKN